MLKDLVSTFGEAMAELENKVMEKVTLDEYSLILVDGKPLLFEIEGPRRRTTSTMAGARAAGASAAASRFR